MNVRTELIAVAVRYLSQNTNLITKPAPFEDLIPTIFTGKTYDERTAEKIDAVLCGIGNSAKHANQIRKSKFKKTTLVK